MSSTNKAGVSQVYVHFPLGGTVSTNHYPTLPHKIFKLFSLDFGDWSF